jgi:hypothetical protein
LLVSREGGPSTPAQAFAKPSDLDVTYIGREPRYPVYIIAYDEGVPYVAESPEGGKTWPSVGDAVTFNAHVVNKGEAGFSGFTYTWRFYINDGRPLWEASGQYVRLLKPGDDVVLSQAWNWYEGIGGGPDHNTHRLPKLVLTVAPNEPDERAANNVREYYPLGKDIAFWVAQDMYEAFNSRANASGSYSYEDWVQYQLKAMNEAFDRSTYPLAPDGIRERVNLEAVYIVPSANAANDWKCPGTYVSEGIFRAETYRGIWDQPRPGGTCGMSDSGNVEWLNSVIRSVDDGLVHELSHQLGLIDSYNLHAGRWDWACPGIMGGGDRSPHCGAGARASDYYSSQDAAALNLGMPYRARYYGDYLFDIPRNIRVRFLAKDGEPLRNAYVEVYLEDSLTQRGLTDGNGEMKLLNRPVPSCASGNAWCDDRAGNGAEPDDQWRNPTLTGHSQHDSPFGQIDVIGTNGVLRFEVRAPNGKWESDSILEERLALDISDANLAYWRGQRESSTFIFPTSLANSPASPEPP